MHVRPPSAPYYWHISSSKKCTRHGKNATLPKRALNWAPLRAPEQLPNSYRAMRNSAYNSPRFLFLTFDSMQNNAFWKAWCLRVLCATSA